MKYYHRQACSSQILNLSNSTNMTTNAETVYIAILIKIISLNMITMILITTLMIGMNVITPTWSRKGVATFVTDIFVCFNSSNLNL